MQSLQTRGVSIAWLNHASFKIDYSGKTAYFDPFVLPAGAPQADLILVTHGHFDHCDAGKIKQVAGGRTVIICAKNCESKLAGIKCKKIIGLAEGERTSVDGVEVIAVPAYNPAKRFHPRGLGVGLVCDFGGARVYHAGDTDFIPEMRDLQKQKISVALLPIGGTYTMTAAEAAQAANAVSPETAVPMHFNYLDGTHGDPQEFASLVDKKINVEILEPQVK